MYWSTLYSGMYIGRMTVQGNYMYLVLKSAVASHARPLPAFSTTCNVEKAGSGLMGEANLLYLYVYKRTGHTHIIMS